MVWPVMNAASSEHRNTTVPSRSCGAAARLIDCARIIASRCSGVTVSRGTSVYTGPGVIALTLMPNSPSSFAIARVIATTAPLLAT